MCCCLSVQDKVALLKQQIGPGEADRIAQTAEHGAQETELAECMLEVAGKSMPKELPGTSAQSLTEPSWLWNGCM